MKSFKKLIIYLTVVIFSLFIFFLVTGTSIDMYMLNRNQVMIQNYDAITKTVTLYDVSKNTFRLYNRNRNQDYLEEYEQNYYELVHEFDVLSDEFKQDIHVNMYYRIIRQMLEERHELIHFYSRYEPVGKSLSEDLEFIEGMSNRLSTQLNNLLSSYLSYINKRGQEQMTWYSSYKRRFNLITLVLVLSIIGSGFVLVTKAKRKLQEANGVIKKIGDRQFDTEDITCTNYRDINVYINTVNDMKHEIIAQIKEIESFADEKIAHEKQGRLLVESQMKALQLQINPHFLFNTLSLVIRHIQLGEKEISIQLTKETSKILRSSLGKIEEMITLDEEIELLESYLFIQRLHLKSRVDIVLDIRKSYGRTQIMVPPLVIQPIVENAVLHGMRETSQNGLIEIKILEKTNYVEVIVKDNGLGMTEEQIDAIFTDHKSEHIGFGNVIQRLQLLYGREIQDIISIESRLNEGTSVKIRLYKGDA